MVSFKKIIHIIFYFCNFSNFFNFHLFLWLLSLVFPTIIHGFPMNCALSSDYIDVSALLTFQNEFEIQCFEIRMKKRKKDIPLKTAHC